MSTPSLLFQSIEDDGLQLTIDRRFGTYSTSESINAGLDIEMPGPSRWRGEAAFLAAATDKLTPTALDDRTRAVLQLVKDCGSSGVPGVDENAQEGTRNTRETAAALRRLAADSVVLLKNEKDILPLKKDKKVSLQQISSLVFLVRLLTITTDSRHRSQRCLPIVLRRRLGGLESLLCRDAPPSHQRQSVGGKRAVHDRCAFIRGDTRPRTITQT